MYGKEKLWEFFDYKDGKLYWKSRPESSFKTKKAAKTWNTRFVGKVAGNVNGGGYIDVTIENRSYRAHRVIFMMFHGYVPEEIDHINRVTHDNRIENLRESTHAQNMQNIDVRSVNKSGYTGVCYRKDSGLWQAYITSNGERIHLGFHKTKEDAAVARNEAAIKYNGDFAKLNEV